ncbi:uncharacterized protein [Nicotiana tomentosiformis]|uniref:uncharacterized protein n=1 Tax=Nicotiana tomentosiformis TaxID=4098 RepID=UPI00388CBD43
MARDNGIELVDTGAQKQLSKRDTGLVKEVRMLRQYMTDMYRAWMTSKAPPPPPPSFLDATLTQASVIVSDDPPYSPDFSAYHSFTNLPSSSIVRPSTTFPKNSPTFIFTTSTITTSQQPLLRSNSEHQFKPHDAQYYSLELAHKISESYNHSPRNEPHIKNGKYVRTGERDEISRKLKGIEQSLKNMQGTGNQINMSYNDLCMFPDVHLPDGSKMPKFNLYDERGDPVAYLRGYCSEMRSVRGKDELLMAYFSESLSGEALEWYTRQDVSKWHAWDDMAQDFVQHFQYNIDIVPDRSSLSKMEKKLEESFREFGLGWREQAALVSPPIDEEEMVKLFLQAQGPTYFSHLIPALGKSFNDVVKMGEMVEEGIKSGKIMSYFALKCTIEDIQNISLSLGGRKRNRKDVVEPLQRSSGCSCLTLSASILTP